MATIKVFDVNGVKVLKCFDTLDNVDYLAPDEDTGAEEEDDDVVDF